VEFSWDEPKREWVLAERGIDFLRVAFSLFDGRPLLTVPTPRGEEERVFSASAPSEENSSLSSGCGGKEPYE
jgi:uncharacterized DUF497 family protein